MPAPSSPTTSSSASRSPNCRRTASSRCCAARRKKCSRLSLDTDTEEPEPGTAPSTRAGSRTKFDIADRGRRRRHVAARHRPLGMADQMLVSLGIDIRMRLRQSAEKDAVDVFATNLRICCSPRRPEPAPPWAWTRVSVPAPRSPSSTAPARSSPPTRSTRTSRRASGKSLAMLAGLVAKHRCRIDRDRQRHGFA